MSEILNPTVPDPCVRPSFPPSLSPSLPMSLPPPHAHTISSSEDADNIDVIISTIPGCAAIFDEATSPPMPVQLFNCNRRTVIVKACFIRG